MTHHPQSQEHGVPSVTWENAAAGAPARGTDALGNRWLRSAQGFIVALRDGGGGCGATAQEAWDDAHAQRARA